MTPPTPSLVTLAPQAAPSPSSSPSLLHAHGNYFATTDGTGVYLAGNHTWTSGVGYKNAGSTDFGAYLNMLQAEDANLIRYWTWNETVGYHDGAGQVTTPLPFLRSSSVPGEGDGGNKFDLSKFNQLYFDKLHADVQAAASKGVYVSVMLFFDADPQNIYQTWRTDYWNGANNVNGTTTSNIQVEQGTSPRTLVLQEAYLAKVLDTLQGQPNVLYEIANEPNNDPRTVAWESTLIDFVHSYEKVHGYMQHPVGITANYPAGNTGTITQSLMATNADWVSPSSAGYQANPPAATGDKVVIVDTDHVFGIGGDASWVWQQFTRGYNVLYMDDLNGTGVSGTLKLNLTAVQLAQEVSARIGIAETRQISQMVGMTSMKPANALSSTGYALANPTQGEYIVYSPYSGSITVNLSGAADKFLNAQWLNVANGQLSSVSTVMGGFARQGFADPYAEGVLILTPGAPVAVTESPPVNQDPPANNPLHLSATYDAAAHQILVGGDFANNGAVLIYEASAGRPIGPGTGTGITTLARGTGTFFLADLPARADGAYTIQAIENGVVGQVSVTVGATSTPSQPVSPPSTPVTPRTGPNLNATFDPATHKVYITGVVVNTSPVLLYGAADGKPIGPGTGTGFTTIQHTGAISFSANVVASGSSTYGVEATEGGIVGLAVVRVGSGAATFNLRQADVSQDLLSGFRVGQDHLHVTDVRGVVLSRAADTALIGGATSDTNGNTILHLSADHEVMLSGVGVANLSASIFR